MASGHKWNLWVCCCSWEWGLSELKLWISRHSKGLFSMYSHLCSSPRAPGVCWDVLRWLVRVCRWLFCNDAAMGPRLETLSWDQNQTAVGWRGALWPARSVFLLALFIFLGCRAGSGPSHTQERTSCSRLKPCPCNAVLCPWQQSAECVSEKDAGNLLKGTKIRVFRVPLLTLVWTYWFTSHFSQFWHVIR